MNRPTCPKCSQYDCPNLGGCLCDCGIRGPHQCNPGESTQEDEKEPSMHWGLVMSRGRFLWATDAWYWWIPFQDQIMGLWNNYACRRWGHDDILFHLAQSGHISESDADCTNCCRHLTECTGAHRLGYQSEENDDGPEIN